MNDKLTKKRTIKRATKGQQKERQGTGQIDEKNLLANITQRELTKLLDRAMEDPELATELIADPESIIHRQQLAIDTNSEEYQDFALRLYAVRVMLNQSMDDLLTEIDQELP